MPYATHTSRRRGAALLALAVACSVAFAATPATAAPEETPLSEHRSGTEGPASRVAPPAPLGGPGVTDLALAESGVIAGAVEAPDGYTPDGSVELYDSLNALVETVPMTGSGTSASYEFTEVADGDYTVKFVGVTGMPDQWYNANDSYSSDASVVTLPGEGDASSLDLGTWTLRFAEDFPADGEVHLHGELNVPQHWSSSTVCVGAYRWSDGILVGTDCGAQGSDFVLRGLEPSVEYGVVFVDAHLSDSQSAWDNFTGNFIWWGYDYESQLLLFEEDVDGAWWIPVYPFYDVPGTHTFYFEITWMGASGVSEGYQDGTFRPGAAVSRQAMAAFMFRFAGSPDDVVMPAESPFSDVPTDHPFYEEIVWMAQEGISTGYPDETFRPGDTVSRQAMAAFMHRLMGEPVVDAPATSPFEDVPTDHPFYQEIVWMSESGISTGYADGDFRSVVGVSRQAMSAFMYRLLFDVVLA